MSWSKSDEARIAEVRQGRRKTLGLRFHALKVVPDEIYELPHLEGLDLRGNQIRAVPERIRELPNLRDLNLAWNPIEEVPDVPGLGLDWSAYLRCRESLSLDNVVGIEVHIEELPEPSRLFPEIASVVSTK